MVLGKWSGNIETLLGMLGYNNYNNYSLIVSMSGILSTMAYKICIWVWGKNLINVLVEDQ